MGVDGEFIVSPRLDDLQCAYGTLAGFLAADDGKKSEKGAKKEAQGEYGAVYALFDNEEIGSGTKQGRIPPSFQMLSSVSVTHWN